MSLLMDALKRAETSKQEAARSLTGRDSGAATNLGLEPINARDTGRQLPNLAQHIDSLNADLEAGAPPQNRAAAPQPKPEPSPAQQLNDDENRAAIRNAFATKEVKPASRAPLWLALGTLGLAAVGIGGYVVYQLQSMNAGSLGAAPSQRQAQVESPRPNPAMPLSAPTPATQTSPPAIPILSTNSPSTAIDSTSASRLEQPGAYPVQTEASQRGRYPGAEAGGPVTPQIRLVRTRPEPDANIQRGYAHLQGNSLDSARRDYEQALRNDPNNVDALLALGAIAQRQGQTAEADRYQQRAYIADPRDAGAQAAALGGNSGSDPQAIESRLKTLLAAQPDSAQLNFALGNLYAKQARWNEAQQVYFNAVAGDTDNPDYLFNLAISLDQLRQPKLAAQHYRMALEAAERRPAAFDRERISKRLSQIAP
jgi:tetratricopeptide (TPR) repeat protein